MWSNVHPHHPGAWPADAALNGSGSAAGNWLTTKPFAVPAGSSLHLNVETALSAELIIQVWRSSVRVLAFRIDPHLTLACNLCRQLGDTKSIPIVGDYTDITVQFADDKAPSPTGAVAIKFLMRGEVNLYSWWWA